VAETPSPITGAEGNREYFLHLRAAGSARSRARETRR